MSKFHLQLLEKSREKEAIIEELQLTKQMQKTQLMFQLVKNFGTVAKAKFNFYRNEAN